MAIITQAQANLLMEVVEVVEVEGVEARRLHPPQPATMTELNLPGWR